MIWQNTGPSGGKLANFLGCSLKMPYNNQDKYRKFHFEIKGETKLPNINYGCGCQYIPVDSINYLSQIVSDKLYCFKIFDALNIPYPKLIDNPKDYNDFFIGRKNNSSQGRGIIKFKPKSESIDKYPCDFYVEYIRGIKEMRVHVWGDHILLELNKDFSKNGHNFIRNYHNGSKLVPGYIDHEDRQNILNKCKEAIEYAGLTYGAVDIIVDENNKWYFLEINSAPKLSYFYALIYAQHLNRIYNLNLYFPYYVTKEYEVLPISKSYFY